MVIKMKSRSTRAMSLALVLTLHFTFLRPAAALLPDCRSAAAAVRPGPAVGTAGHSAVRLHRLQTQSADGLLALQRRQRFSQGTNSATCPTFQRHIQLLWCLSLEWCSAVQCSAVQCYGACADSSVVQCSVQPAHRALQLLLLCIYCSSR
jgi:hypothetical protein